MRILIFSDTHLTDRFDKKKYIFLKKIIFSADHVIINGDFWDGYEIYFNQFIRSEWKKLFPLLKKKNTVYLYGNHDKKSLSDQRVNLFSVKQAQQYSLRSGKLSFWIEHGNKYFPDWEETFPIKQPNYFINTCYTIVEKLLFTVFKTKIQTGFLHQFNKKIKKIIQKKIPKDYIFICGHTHAQELDLKNRFINTGIIRHGIGQYLLIENGKLKLKSERYDNSIFKFI